MRTLLRALELCVTRTSCNLSSIGCTSFFPSKPLGCYGDGGAIFTSDDDIAKNCKEIRVHGQSRRYLHSQIGVGGRMDTLQCAIVLAKLSAFEDEIAKRQEMAQKYNKFMEELGIEKIKEKTGNFSVFAQYTIISEQRDRLIKLLTENKIPTAVHYPTPLNAQPAFRHTCCPDCTPIAAKLSSKVLSLPMGPYLTPDDQNKVMSALAKSINFN